jgi:hypothetical protein
VLCTAGVGNEVQEAYGITIDNGDNLYFTAAVIVSGYFQGDVCELPNGSTTPKILYSGGYGPGGGAGPLLPYGITIDSAGNLYGTTWYGNPYGPDAVW